MPPTKKPPKKPTVKDTKKKTPTVKPPLKDTEENPNKPDDTIPFILENLQSLPNLLGPRKAPTLANFNNLKNAFQPFGQDENPLSAAKQDEWKEQLKSFKTTAKAKKWPHEVPSFELWAAATAYNPSIADGRPEFQRMMQHLLVGNGTAKTKFNEDGYYHQLTKRSDGWYKYQPSYGKVSYKDGPHHLGRKTGERAWHTAKTQALWLGGDKGDGGATGMDNNNTKPRQINDSKIGVFDITVAIKPASKTNWLYHCLGIEVDKMDGDAAGNNNSANQFVTDGTAKNCGEPDGGCTALGNTLAAFIGLYYYPECNNAGNNWVVTQTRNSHTYNVRMRMWNPRYELQNTTYENLGIEITSRRLLVRELKNAFG